MAVVANVAEPRIDLWRRKRDQLLVLDAHDRWRWTIAASALFHLAIFGVLIGSGYPIERVVASALVYTAFAISQSSFMRYARSRQRIDGAIIGINITAQVMVVGIAICTGGIHSPFLVSLMVPSVSSLLFFGPHSAARWMATANALLVVAMVCLPDWVVGDGPTHAAYSIVALLTIGWNVLLLHQMVRKLSSAARSAGESVACMREERVSGVEAQLRRLQSVGAKVAHELKNPLASIKGLCQLVARTPDSERTQERLTVVASEISRMETILAEYLSFSRPLEDLKPERIDLTAIAKDVIDVLAGRADQAGVALALAGDQMPAKGDPRRLKEALINLVANAIEATPDGGTVTLQVARTASAITLSVVDTGRGISPEDLERLGTSFFTTRPNGTGLGVVLAQGVITQHGGSLQYKSRTGAGTTATITLPLEVAAVAEMSPRAAASVLRA